MIATPMICPECGELVVVWPDTDGRALVIPEHPDAVMPSESCVAGMKPVSVQRG
jgi:hypothetical protein